ncbi:MAG: DUF1592 domain-containing protein [Verrucomicrobiota bacterium]
MTAIRPKLLSYFPLCKRIERWGCEWIERRIPRIDLSKRMIYLRFVVSGLVLALFGAGAMYRFDVTLPSLSASQSTYSFVDDVEPILMDYCYDCHGDGAGKGGIKLDDFANYEELVANLEMWEGVHHNIDAFLMPPSEKPQMEDSEREILATWIEQEVFRLDPRNPDPGRVTIRRLNREEYRNSVRDLLGNQHLDPSEDLPPDDTGYGFDNVGDVLSMSPGLFEKYAIAADRVLSSVIRTRPPEPGRVVVSPEDDFRGVRHASSGTGVLASAGAVGAKLKVPRDGEYTLRILAGADHAGNELPRMLVKFHGGNQKEFEVKAGREQPQYCEMPVKAQRGDRWLEMAFVNDFYDPNNKNPQRRDRNLHIFRAELIGPLNLKPPPPSPTQKALFSVAGPGPEEDQARRIVSTFARKAWRKPVSKEEVDRLLQFVKLAKNEGDSFEMGIKLALQATLVSPHFLFRAESQARPDDPGKIHKIDEHALASRLSYFLWSSTPDDRLLNLADAGKLRENLGAEIDRMIVDPKIEALTENFAGQWLQLRNLDIVMPDPQTYRGWNRNLRDDMREETERFFSTILAENRSVLEFLETDFTFLNEALARHYGIGGIKGNNFRRVFLTDRDRSRRGGVLGHASILTITSNPTRTSPVSRGNWVLENLLGTPPPPPLEGIPDLEETKKKAGKKLTMRQQLEMHRKDPICASCHARMDPIGFALENYDGIGRWREDEEGQKIDPIGQLYTGEAFQSASDLKQLLAEQKGEAFAQNLAEKLLTFALGRGVEYYDQPALNVIHDHVSEHDFRFQSFIHAIAESVPFQYRRGETLTP